MPRKFLELILADLREAGFLHSHRGKMGGYRLSRPTHLISLGEIIRVIEGPLALVPCVSRTAYRPCHDCKDEASCAIRHAMMRVRDETARILDGTSLADAERRGSGGGLTSFSPGEGARQRRMRGRRASALSVARLSIPLPQGEGQAHPRLQLVADLAQQRDLGRLGRRAPLPRRFGASARFTARHHAGR